MIQQFRNRRLLQRIRKNDESLVEVSMIDRQCGPALALSLVDALRNGNNSSVQTLWLSGNSFGDEGTRHFTKLLSDDDNDGTMNKTNVRHLILGANGIGAEGIQVLSKGLEHKPLDVICLGSNLAGDEGLKYISEAIASGSIRHEFWYRNNGVTSVGASYLARALARSGDSCCILQQLWLSGNSNLGDKGASILAEALTTQSCSLELLDLEDCGLSNTALRALCRMLLANHSLCTLKLGQNENMTDTNLMDLLQELLKLNASKNKKPQQQQDTEAKKKKLHVEYQSLLEQDCFVLSTEGQ